MVKRKITKGFTLIEILIAVIIIGILSSVAFPRITWLVERSKGAEAREVLYKAYAGYQRLLIDEEPIGGLNPLTWTRMGMSDPNTMAGRFFDYTLFPPGNPNRVDAERIGDSSKWVRIDLSSGCLTRTSPY